MQKNFVGFRSGTFTIIAGPTFSPTYLYLVLDLQTIGVTLRTKLFILIQDEAAIGMFHILHPGQTNQYLAEFYSCVTQHLRAVSCQMIVALRRVPRWKQVSWNEIVSGALIEGKLSE